MQPQERLTMIAQELAEGRAVPPVTVRELLSWFGAQRRGYGNISQIRLALQAAGLRTEPAFEAVYIDSEVAFLTVTCITGPAISIAEPKAVAGSAEITGYVPKLNNSAVSDEIDPASRVSRLKAANNKPVSVFPTSTIAEAATLMIGNHFSQLPVMTSDRDVKGVISWLSIGNRLCIGQSGEVVKDFMDTAKDISADASIFDVIPIIAHYDYVLVRAPDRRVTGIITSSDLNLQFQELAEPFLLLGEIENHIRRLIGTRFTVEELASARSPSDSARPVDTVSDLSFGEYLRLLENTERWTKLGIKLDRKAFCEQFSVVRDIRNDVMHFDPDPVTPEDLSKLRDASRFLQRLASLKVI